LMQEETKYARIWRTVAAIPPGKVAAYGLVADLAGLPGRARYVSRALKAAPDDLALPWHRVLRADGRIAFEAGSEAAREQVLRLRGEGVEVNRNRVDISRFGWKPTLGELLEMDY
jgi:methylated-DNA-protein-cysteine methyltransferase-like protein